MTVILQTTFKMHFIERNALYLDRNLNEVCSQEPFHNMQH